MSKLGRPLLQSVTRVVGALKLPVLVANPFATNRLPLHAQNFPLVLLYTARAGSAALISGSCSRPVSIRRPSFIGGFID